jgi:hypothetical protein
MKRINRRRVLRGMVDGGAVTVALPLLDCFLNGNGTALASGAPLPVRFGTWFWGLGMNKSVFIPKKIGADYDLPEEIEALKDVRQHINVITNAAVYRDTAQNLCHYTGWIIGRTGMAPSSASDKPGETFDVTVANQIGRTTRFRLLTAAATGDARTTYSYENANSPNAPDINPLTFYTRLFGPDFQDPNAPTFTPNPRIMVRKSALSGVMSEAKAMEGVVGAADKARLDQYFTGLRHLERQFEQQLTKPAPNAACHPAAAPKDDLRNGGDTTLTAQRHNMLTDLMVMAVACDQTRVFNMAYSNAAANTTKSGYEKPHHTTTHEEPIDNALGYQPNASWFTRRSMESWAYFVDAFSKIKEGDGTLLDNVLIYADTDVGYARVHSLDGMAMFTAGRAGGKIKTGLHIDAGGTPGARLNLTLMRALGVNIDSWGTKSNATSKEISEILT